MKSLFTFHPPFEPTSAPNINLHATVHDAHLVQYAILAALALQVYNYITNLDDEIRLIWRRTTPWSRRILFLSNRYLPFITAFSALYCLLFNRNQDYCHPAHFTVAFLALSGVVIAEWSLYLRTSTICSNKAISVILLFLAVVTPAGTAVNTYYYIRGSMPLEIGVPRKGCLFWYRLKIEWISLLALIFCETVAFCFLVTKTILYCRHSKSNIMIKICRDSIFYFICIIGSSVVNLLIQLFASSLLCDALLIPQSILHQILCTHFILRLRRLSEKASRTVDGQAPDPSSASWCESDVTI